MFFKSSTSSADFITRLKAAPVVQEALRAIETDELEVRKGLIAEMDSTSAALRTFAAMRTKRESEINAEILAVEKRRIELGTELNELDAAGSRVRSTTGRELGELTARVKSGADQRINNFVLWSQRAYSLAVDQTWQNIAKAFTFEPGTKTEVATATRAAQESVARMSALVTASLERAEAMRLEATMPDDVLLELRAMAAAIHAEYASQPRTQSLSKDFLAPIPGVTIVEVSEINEPVQG